MRSFVRAGEDCNIAQRTDRTIACRLCLQSPLYDGAQFVGSEDVINQVDVGMTALYAEDCLALSNISSMLGQTAFAEELKARGEGLVEQMNNNLVRQPPTQSSQLLLAALAASENAHRTLGLFVEQA
jgi:hypothetical protein